MSTDRLLDNARLEAFDEVLELLDSEAAKFKERGDLATAEIIEVMRAKVHAKKTKGAAP